MGRGYHRGTGGSSGGGFTDAAFLVVLFGGLAFPFAMYGLAVAAEAVADKYGGLAGFAVFLTPVWIPLVAVMLKARASQETNGI